MRRSRETCSRAALGCLTMMVLAALVGACATRTDTRKQIQEIYVHWNDLSQRRDIDGLAAMLHQDFAYTDETGRVEARPAFVDRVKQALAVSRGLRYEVEVKALHEAGDATTAETHYIVHMEFQQDGKWIPVTRDLDLVDTFVRHRGGWLLRSSRVVKVNEPPVADAAEQPVAADGAARRR